MVKEKPQKKKFFSARNVWMIILSLLVAAQFVQIQMMSGNLTFLEGKDSSLFGELGGTSDRIGQIGESLNELRQFIGLPPLDYATTLEGENDGDNENIVQISLFKYVEFLKESKDIQKNLKNGKKILTDLSGDENFKKLLADKGLSQVLNEDKNHITLTVSAPESGVQLSYNLDKENGKMTLATPLSQTILTINDSLKSEIASYVNKNWDLLKKQIADFQKKKVELETAINSQKVQNILSERGIKISFAGDVDAQIGYNITNGLGDFLGEIIFKKEDRKIYFRDANDEKSVNETKLEDELSNLLKNLDTSTSLQKEIDNLKKSLEETFTDKGFLALLKESGLKVETKPKEDSIRIYYRILDANGNHISSVVIEKSTAVVNVVNPDGTNSQNLLFFDPEFKKKTLNPPSEIPKYGDKLLSDKKSFNVMIGGKNGNLIDTIIIAHIDENEKEVKMVSVPRDLFYEGKKINSYAFYFGMEAFVDALQKISGYKIDKYAVIDMYAFIDVVDLMGGLDIHLDKALIDPNYKTIDNGKVGTLYYEPGDYHLGGKEVLRLARSRKTSSDFARAERQQMILKAMQDKAQNLGFGDVKTVYKLAKVILGNLETNVGVDEALKYYFRYQNFEIASTAVLSSGNVLYSPPYVEKEKCDNALEALSEDEKKICEANENAYTLLPRDDNWDAIKWFFRQQYEY